VLLDFPNLSTWHTGETAYLKSVTSASPPEKRFTAGDKMTIKFRNTTIRTSVLVNNEREFRWGGKAVIASGEHCFLFKANQETGGTTFVQEEQGGGGLAGMFYSGSTTTRNFEKFNQDLKDKCEARK